MTTPHADQISITLAEWDAKCEREKELEAEVARLREDVERLNRPVVVEQLGDDGA